MSILTLVYLFFLPRMDSISVCIRSHFYSVSVFSSIRGQIAACFSVPLCSCQLFSKHLSIICFRFHPFQSLLLFYCSTSVHLIDCACRQIHSSLLLKALFFIPAISLLFKIHGQCGFVHPPTFSLESARIHSLSLFSLSLFWGHLRGCGGG